MSLAAWCSPACPPAAGLLGVAGERRRPSGHGTAAAEDPRHEASSATRRGWGLGNGKRSAGQREREFVGVAAWGPWAWVPRRAGKPVVALSEFFFPKHFLNISLSGLISLFFVDDYR